MPTSTPNTHPMEETEPLALTVQMLRRLAGSQAEYDDINAALGLSWIISSARDEDCPGRWMDYGSDFNLPAAARLFGLRLRELHPPEASVGLERAAEFDQHFDASYRPLIDRALEHRQPVLVWQGWPPPDDLNWGIISALSRKGVGFSGYQTGTASPTVLVRPPIQMYVVEEIAPTKPDRAAVWSVARAALHRVARRDVDPRTHSNLFEDAYERWLFYIQRQFALGCPTKGHTIAACHQRLAQRVVGARKSAIGFLKRHRECLPPRFRPGIDTMVTLYGNLVEQLAESCTLERASAAVRSLEGLSKLRLQVQAARDMDRTVWTQVVSLVGAQADDD